MKCDKFKSLMAEVTGRAKKSEVESYDPQRLAWEKHLLNCESCLDYYQQYSTAHRITDTESIELSSNIISVTSAELKQMDNFLQQLQIEEPPAGFTEQVLQRTVQKQAIRSRFSYLRNRVKALILRPRIAQEFSFAATMVWVLAFGLPDSMSANIESFAEGALQFSDLIRSLSENITGDNLWPIDQGFQNTL